MRQEVVAVVRSNPRLRDLQIANLLMLLLLLCWRLLLRNVRLLLLRWLLLRNVRLLLLLLLLLLLPSRNSYVVLLNLLGGL